MALDYQILPKARVILVQAGDIVTPEDHERLAGRLMREPALEEGLPMLVDARGSEASITVNDLPRVVTLTRMLVRRGLDIIAIVADPGPMLTLAEAFQVAGSAAGLQIAVFEDITAARTWLRLGEAPNEAAQGNSSGRSAQ